MRFILALFGLAAIVLVILMATGMVSVDQTRTAQIPTLKLEGGQAPEFKASVGKVEMGTTNKTVQVPTVSTTDTNIQVPSLTVERAEDAPPPAK